MDFAARLGGEQLVVLLPLTGLAGAMTATEGVAIGAHVTAASMFAHPIRRGHARSAWIATSILRFAAALDQRLKLVRRGDDPQDMRITSTLGNFGRPLLVAALAIGAILSVTFLDQRVDSSRSAELSISRLSTTLQDLEAAPFSADRAFNPGQDARSPNLLAIVRHDIASDEATLMQALSNARRRDAPAAVVATGELDLREVRAAVFRVYELASAPGGLGGAGAKKVAAAQANLARPLSGVRGVLATVAQADGLVARHARVEAIAGTILTIALLLAVFGIFYFRSQRLVRENDALLDASREEASTDELTGLGNRRSLTEDLHREIARERPAGDEVLVSIYDLDGFKQYNDTFGHAAGDALLVRLAGRLSAAVSSSGTAYRMGGDEFCVVAACAAGSAEALIGNTLSALTDSGEGWEISCSQGAVWVPSEAGTFKDALRSADVRMYADKAGRSSTGRQVADALVQVLYEQDIGMDEHGGNVASLAADVAISLNAPALDVQRIRLAARLHDIGKTALPASLLNKPGALDADQWSFVQRHTVIGERIVLAAPALAATAPLIRSSHEHLDGTGYPDGLRGEEIPLGSRIISACDAYDAITSNRSYRSAATREEAIEELRRCAGKQFDPDVVDALCTVVLSAPDSSSPPHVATVELRSK